jgi:uncharacterized protein (TIGR02466 family)
MAIQFTSELQPIFPTPVMITNVGRDFTEEELNFLLNLEQRPNALNQSNCEHRVLENEILTDLKKLLHLHLENFFYNVVKPKEKITPYITQSWVNYTTKGQAHHTHSHSNSFISGVLYIQASSETDKIFFYKNVHKTLDIDTEEHNLFNSDSWFFTVETKQLVLFPSSLYHSVKPVEGEQTRISLSFNSFLRGSLGSPKLFTHLQLD